MWHPVVVVSLALALAGLILALTGRRGWAAGCFWSVAVVVAAYLMDVALREG